MSAQDLTIHRFASHDVRVFTHEGEPVFAARDVCNVLDITAYRDAVARLDEDERVSVVVDTLGGAQGITAITESGLYSLIFRSRKPEAVAFKRWVTHEVLPTIRRTGGYTGAAALPTDYPSALRALAAEHEARQLSEDRVRVLEPKGEYVDRFVSTDDLVTVRSAAGQLGVKESELRGWLMEKGWIYRVHIGRRFSQKSNELVDEWEYRARADHGDAFRLRAQHNAPRHHNNQIRQTLYLTPDGMTQLSRRFAATSKAVTA